MTPAAALMALAAESRRIKGRPQRFDELITGLVRRDFSLTDDETKQFLETLRRPAQFTSKMLVVGHAFDWVKREASKGSADFFVLIAEAQRRFKTTAEALDTAFFTKKWDRFKQLRKIRQAGVSQFLNWSTQAALAIQCPDHESKPPPETTNATFRKGNAKASQDDPDERPTSNSGAVRRTKPG